MSHQTRREPLPATYQFPTHGEDCDCPPCRNRFLVSHAVKGMIETIHDDLAALRKSSDMVGYGHGV